MRRTPPDQRGPVVQSTLHVQTGGLPAPSLEQRIVRVERRVLVEPLDRWELLVRALCFQRQCIYLGAYAPAEGGTYERDMWIELHPKGPWTDADSTSLIDDVIYCLDVHSGMPWLSVREVLAYMAAERAVQRVDDEQASELFALLRQTDRSAWSEILKPVIDNVKPYTEEAGKQVVGTAAVAALKALAHLVGIPVP